MTDADMIEAIGIAIDNAFGDILPPSRIHRMATAALAVVQPELDRLRALSASLAREGDDGELCKRLEAAQPLMEDCEDGGQAVFISRDTAKAAAARIRSLSSRVERAEQLAYTGAISLASIDEGATLPETWKERAENRQAVFLLAKRRAEAAESEAAALREALRPFVSHYEPWMERQADGDRMCVYPVHTMGDLRRARAALSAPARDEEGR